MYILNNIRFRSVSSKALERYYNAKSFILNELVDEKNQFSETAREIMLLFFNNYSEWALKVESLLLNRTTITEDDVQIILTRYGELIESNKLIFGVHAEVFKPEFISVWGKNHKHIQRTFKDVIKSSVGLSQMQAYPIIIDALVSALQTTLFELYEVDCLLGSDLVLKKVTSNRTSVANLVTYVDECTENYYNKHGVNVIAERVRSYSDILKVPELDVVIKNYTQKSVALRESDLVGNVALTSLLREVQSLPGVKIIDVIQR
jgi:hypothetical protein